MNDEHRERSFKALDIFFYTIRHRIPPAAPHHHASSPHLQLLRGAATDTPWTKPFQKKIQKHPNVGILKAAVLGLIA
jgi:hypothetical protein